MDKQAQIKINDDNIERLKSYIKNHIDNLTTVDINSRKNIYTALEILITQNNSKPLNKQLKILSKNKNHYVEYQGIVSHIKTIITNLHERNNLLNIIQIIDSVDYIQRSDIDK